MSIIIVLYPHSPPF